MAGIFDTINDIKSVISNTAVDGTGWKVQAAIWASKVFYVRHKDYLVRMVGLTRRSRNGVRKTVDQVVNYIGGLKLEDFVISAIATMTDTEKTLVVYLAFAQLRTVDPEAERLFPTLSFTTGNAFTINWSDDLPQDEAGATANQSASGSVIENDPNKGVDNETDK